MSRQTRLGLPGCFRLLRGVGDAAPYTVRKKSAGRTRGDVGVTPYGGWKEYFG